MKNSIRIYSNLTLTGGSDARLKMAESSFNSLSGLQSEQSVSCMEITTDVDDTESEQVRMFLLNSVILRSFIYSCKNNTDKMFPL